MKGLKSFIVAHFRYAVRVPWGTFLSFLVSVTFSVVMTLQIFFTYRITQFPFPDLPFDMFLLCFFMNQVIFFIGLALGVGNVGKFCKTLISGGIDMMLLRPVPMVFFMFARKIRVDHILMMFIYMILFFSQAVRVGFGVPEILMMFFYCVLSGTLYILIVTILNGIGCLLRNVDNIQRVSTNIDEFLQNRPPEIFPKPIQLFFTFVIPQMFIGSYIFDLVRHKNTDFIWITLVTWVVVLALVDFKLWQNIFKNYESIG